MRSNLWAQTQMTRIATSKKSLNGGIVGTCKLSSKANAKKGGEDGYNSHMKEIAAREAKNHFGRLLDVVQSTPVRVTKKGRAVGVMMSMRQYERLRGVAWERLAATMDALGEEASTNGLTETGLEALLADES